MTESVNLYPVKRIAILPFDNLSDEINAGERVTHVFIASLHKERVVQILELGEVERFLIRNRIRSTSQIDLGLLSALGRELGVDAVLLGIVDEYGYRIMSGELIPVVGITIRMLDTKTGKIMLAASYSRSGMDSETVFTLGRIRSVTQLTDKVSRETAEALADRFPGKLLPSEETAWLTPRGPAAEETDQTAITEPIFVPPPTGDDDEDQRSLEEIEEERARQNGKSRTQEWYEEIKRRREAAE
jgi:TolB-like protein